MYPVKTPTNQFEISQNWEHTFTIPTKSYPQIYQAAKCTSKRLQIYAYECIDLSTFLNISSLTPQPKREYTQLNLRLIAHMKYEPIQFL